MSKTDYISIGNCGEYFVAAELERNGFTVAVPMSNTKSFDVLAINRENNKQIAIQVKTNHTDQKTWTLSQKNESLIDDNVYYVFVNLNGNKQPSYYIMPSFVVAKSIQKSHANFLSGKTKSGKAGKDTTIRKFSFEISRYNPYFLLTNDYESKWDRLGKKYYDLTKFLSIFYEEYFGQWLTIEDGADGSAEHPFHFPCFSYSDNIEEFISAVYLFIEDHPEMELESFKEILSKNNIEIENIKSVDVSRCDAKCVCAMIVSNVLAEKFCEGAVLSSCEDKTFIKWLERLREIDEE